MGIFMSCCFKNGAVAEEKVVATLDPLECIDKSQLELILQHLTGREILDASKVSRNWYKKLGKSEMAMKKIQVKVVDGPKSWNKAIVILFSSRSYQNMLVNSQNKRQIIATYAPSLVQLTIKDYDVLARDLEMPKLKKLMIDGNVIVDGLLGCAKNLEELHVKSIRVPAIDFLIACLKKNNELKVLSLGSSPCVIFREDLASAFKFHLRKLSVKLFFVSELDNFYWFINKQAESLEELSIHSATCRSTFFNIVINNMQKLQKLEIFGAGGVYNCPPCDLPDELDLDVNTSIKVLLMENVQLENMRSLKLLVDALPNLESLTVFDASDEAFKFTLQHAKKLQEFKTLRNHVKIVDE